MSTSNIFANATEWTKAANASDSDFLITWSDARSLEISTTEFDIAPVIRGHRFPMESTITREMVGAGYVWVKSVTSGINAAFTVVVTKTASASGAVGGYDIAEQVHKVAMFSWNPLSLAWERSTASGDSGGGGSVQVTKRFDITSSYIYVGEAAVGSSESNPVWLIKRIQLDGSGSPMDSKLANGVWNNRSSLSYQ